MGSRDSWMDMAARSPWPVGIVVGVVMCALFSWVIPSMMAASDNPYLGPLGRTLREHQFGYIGYVILAMCWLGSLVSFIRQRKRSKAKPKEASGTPGFSALASESEPACPKCAQPMVMRTARATGDKFWGCSAFPRCRGTLPIRQ